MKTINGQSEQEYLLGAIEVLRRELSTSHNKLEVMERIDSLKDCLILTLTSKGD